MNKCEKKIFISNEYIDEVKWFGMIIIVPYSDMFSCTPRKKYIFALKMIPYGIHRVLDM